MSDRSGPVAAIKKHLRRKIREEILALPPVQRASQEAAFARLMAELPGYASARTVLLYVKAFPEEIDTAPLLEKALAESKRVLCPRVDRSGRRLRLFLVSDPKSDLGPGTLNILEPLSHCPEFELDAVDWVLVPGLAFDRQYYRLGRGAGYYDRLLPRLRPEVLRWALAFDCQLVDRLPVEHHDAPVDGIATPTKVLTRDGPRSPVTAH